MGQNRSIIDRVKGFFRRYREEFGDNAEEQRDVSIEEKIAKAIAKCEQDKRQAEEAIRQLRRWSNEAINKAFYVPSEYWYNELSHYEKIKFLVENEELSSDIVEQSDEIVAGYVSQIEMHRAQIVLCDNLLAGYRKNLRDMEKAKRELAEQKAGHDKQLALEKHADRLKALQDDVSELRDSYRSSQTYERLSKELKEVEDDFQLKALYHQQMEELTKTYKGDIDISNSDIYKDEIERISQNVKNRSPQAGDNKKEGE